MELVKYLIIPIIACSWIGVFLYKKYAVFTGIISTPNYRTLHELPIPRGGGIVFSLLSILAIFFIWWTSQLTQELLLALVVGGGIATLLGFIDDIANISARIKLIIQLILACWVVYCLYFGGLLIVDLMPLYMIVLIVLFLMVWMINAYNFLDGIDGMAASGAIFVSLAIALVLFLTEGPVEIMAIFILIASTVIGFIIFNWPPATIFMGDAGSVFLGYIFGVLLLFTVLNKDVSIWIWLTVFGYFFADTVLTQGLFL